MKTTNLINCLCVLALTIAFPTCKKLDESSGTAAREVFARVVAASDASALWVFDDLFNNVLGVNNEVGFGGLGIFNKPNNSSDCFEVKITQVNTGARFPLQIEINFGDGCVGEDGRTRKGQLIIIYTGNIGTSGSMATASFRNYYVDNLQVQGKFQITNTSEQGTKKFNVQVLDARLISGDNDYIQWNSEKTIIQTDGMQTPLIGLDDSFAITGLSNGSAFLANRYLEWGTATATPLMKKFTCPWFSQGQLLLYKDKIEAAALDYGTGGCDRKASLTLNGTAHEITLH